MKATAMRWAAIVVLGGTPFISSGEDSVLQNRLADAFEAGELEGLHSVLVLHKGETLVEAHFRGKDNRWGTPLGERDHGPDVIHDLRSVTKPIVGLLYGIALSEGKVPDIDAPLIEHFPEYADLAEDPERESILVRHALSMTMGTEWNEDLPYSNPDNSEIAMERAVDRYRYVLDRPMVNTPGDHWVYNGGAVAIIAKLIADGTGMSIDDYAEQKLFAPLDIQDVEWVHGDDGEPSAASGLRLNIHDLAKIGQLVLDKGRHDGQQIVPADWLDASFVPGSQLEDGLRYGYLWWLAPGEGEPRWVSGFGNGGQRLTIQPQYELVIALYAGNYNKPDAWQLPIKVIEQFLAPALEETLAR